MFPRSKDKMVQPLKTHYILFDLLYVTLVASDGYY